MLYSFMSRYNGEVWDALSVYSQCSCNLWVSPVTFIAYFDVALLVHICINSYCFHWGSLKGRNMNPEALKYFSISLYSYSNMVGLFFFSTSEVVLCVFYLKYLNPSEIFLHSFLGLFDYVLWLFSRIIFVYKAAMVS